MRSHITAICLQSYRDPSSSHQSFQAETSEVPEHYTAHSKGQEQELPTTGESLLI